MCYGCDIEIKVVIPSASTAQLAPPPPIVRATLPRRPETPPARPPPAPQPAAAQPQSNPAAAPALPPPAPQPAAAEPQPKPAAAPALPPPQIPPPAVIQSKPVARPPLTASASPIPTVAAFIRADNKRNQSAGRRLTKNKATGPNKDQRRRRPQSEKKNKETKKIKQKSQDSDETLIIFRNISTTIMMMSQEEEEEESEERSEVLKNFTGYVNDHHPTPTNNYLRRVKLFLSSQMWKRVDDISSLTLPAAYHPALFHAMTPRDTPPSTSDTVTVTEETVNDNDNITDSSVLIVLGNQWKIPLIAGSIPTVALLVIASCVALCYYLTRRWKRGKAVLTGTVPQLLYHDTPSASLLTGPAPLFSRRGSVTGFSRRGEGGRRGRGTSETHFSRLEMTPVRSAGGEEGLLMVAHATARRPACPSVPV